MEFQGSRHTEVSGSLRQAFSQLLFLLPEHPSTTHSKLLSPGAQGTLLDPHVPRHTCPSNSVGSLHFSCSGFLGGSLGHSSVLKCSWPGTSLEAFDPHVVTGCPTSVPVTLEEVHRVPLKVPRTLGVLLRQDAMCTYPDLGCVIAESRRVPQVAWPKPPNMLMLKRWTPSRSGELGGGAAPISGDWKAGRGLEG